MSVVTGRHRPVLAVLLLVLALASRRGLGQEGEGGDDAVEAPAFSPFGELPVDFGFDFPGGGSLAYNSTAPLLTGLGQLRAAFGGLSNVTAGDLVNVTLPEPLVVAFNTTFTATDWRGREQLFHTSVQYVMDGVEVAFEAVENATGVLEQCLGVGQTTVELQSIQETAECQVMGGVLDESSGECEGAQPAPQSDVLAALGATLNSPAVQGAIADAIDRAIDRRYEKCNYTDERRPDGILPDAPPAPVDPFLGMLITLVLLFVLGILMAVFWCGCCMGCCCWANAPEGEAEKDFLDQCRSITCSRSMPLISRIGFFVVMAVNVGFFLSANLSLGATINIDYIVKGELERMPAFYNFSIAGTAIELIDAGIYLLGIILLGFSVVWPYVKLVILGAMFSFPSGWVRPARRQSVMQWIDTLGKWSMFDVFALSGCMALFYIEVYSPESALYPLGYYGIILSMTPVWGMFANLIAQLLTNTLSAWGLWAHDKAYAHDWFGYHGEGEDKPAGAVAEGAEDDDGGKKDATDGGDGDEDGGKTVVSVFPPARAPALASPPPMPALAVMSQETPGMERQQQFTTWGKLFCVMLLVATLVLIFCGNFVIGFKLRVVGLLGLIQERATPGSSVRYFTPIAVGKEMIRAIPPDGGAGIVFGTWALAIIIIVCTLVVPVAQVLVLLALWAVPMPSVRHIQRLLKANELLNSWQYMEVLIIAVIVGGIQIPILCDLLIGDTCDPIQPILDWMVQKGIMDQATCFNAQVIIEPGLWCLFVASIILYMCSVVVREKAAKVVALYDPFAAAQYKREPTHGQFLYFKRRADALSTIGLLRYGGELEPAAKELNTMKSGASSGSTPVASVVI